MLGTIGWIKGNLMSSSNTASKYNNDNFIPGNPDLPTSGSRLGEGYTELEYIQTTGTQYLDTGFKPGEFPAVEAVIAVVAGWSMSSAKKNGFAQGFYRSLGFGFGGGSAGQYTHPDFYFGETGTVQNTFNLTKWYPEVPTTMIIDYANAFIQFNNTKKAFIPLKMSINTKYSFYLGANNYVYTSSGKETHKVDSYLKEKIYSCKLSENTVLQRDYVPAKRNSDGIAGLYDLVNNTFIGKEGIIAGPIAS